METTLAKNTIALTPLKSEPVEFDRSDVRVVEFLAGGSLITLQDGTQHHVVETVETVLELLKAKVNTK